MIVKTSYTEVTINGPVNWEATGLFNSDGLFTVFLYKDGKVQDATIVLPEINRLHSFYVLETELMKCLERAIQSDSTNSQKSTTSA